MVVPFSASFINEDATLVGPAELHETGLASVGFQPARLLQVLFVCVFAIGETLRELIQFLALEHPGMHSQEGGSGRLRQLHKILPAIGIMAGIPEHAWDFFGFYIAEKTA